MTDRDAVALDAVLAAAAAERRRSEARRRRLTLVLPATITAGWLVFVSAGSHWGRVLDAWPSSVTMVLGSFVAGATPQGGGAIAFPVFTKVLGTPAELARTMGLSIQTFGMGVAAVTILILRRPVEWRVYRAMLIGGLVGFASVAMWWTDWSTPFAAATFPSSWTRIAFTVAIVAMGLQVARRARSPLVVTEAELGRSAGVTSVLVVAGLVGGALSAVSGSGIDALLFTVASLVFGLEPRRAIATSVVVMATLSLVGFVVFGLVGGQLDVATEMVAGSPSVVAVDGTPVTVTGGELIAGSTGGAASVPRFDLFGLLVAAIPVVVWGAPLGATFAARAPGWVLAGLIAALAVAELVSTVILVTLPSLWPTLVVLVGAAASYVAIGQLSAAGERRRLAGRNEVRFTRTNVDTSPRRLGRLSAGRARQQPSGLKPSGQDPSRGESS